MKTAVVLFNLGGPDSPAAVRPFLTNLFDDPAIIRLPRAARWLISRVIAYRRAPVAREIYRHLGGASPILANTEAQARALEAALGEGFRVFIAMRYWRPLSADTAVAVKAWGPDRIVLLPLYPQFSTTTTASSVGAWRRAATEAGLAPPMHLLCCYPDDAGFIDAIATPLAHALDETPAGAPVRVLFSAHGLPERIVAEGDPYRWQVERTMAAVLKRLARPGLDAVLCFQSRVGPLAWLKPATDGEIRRAGAERRSLIVVPIAFVSEHSETLVELDRDYGRLAASVGVPSYRRLPTVGTAPAFIESLAREVRALAADGSSVRSNRGARLCPRQFSGCLCVAAGAA
ncbi:MAG TPA: ferrochelatase [Stellaceae bacterium]|nr:ferrochelatase [Stellaceae bacterium]